MKKAYTTLEAERKPLFEKMIKTDFGEERSRMIKRLTWISNAQRILESTYMAYSSFSEKTAVLLFETFGIKWHEQLK